MSKIVFVQVARISNIDLLCFHRRNNFFRKHKSIYRSLRENVPGDTKTDTGLSWLLMPPWKLVSRVCMVTRKHMKHLPC